MSDYKRTNDTRLGMDWASPKVRGKREAMPDTPSSDVVERLWTALEKYQSPDKTWLQIGKTDFIAALTHAPRHDK